MASTAANSRHTLTIVLRTLVWALSCAIFVSAPLQAFDGEDLRELKSRAMVTRDEDVLEALSLLEEKGIFNTGPAASISVSPAAPRYSHDCTLLVRQSVFSSALARKLTEQALPPEVMEIAIALRHGGIELSGKLDGPLFINPEFTAFLELKMAGPNTTDMIIGEAKVSGFSVKWLAGFAFRFVEEHLKETFGEFATVTDLGKQPDKTHIIRMQVRPEALVPFVGNNAHMSGIECLPGALNIHISMRHSR